MDALFLRAPHRLARLHAEGRVELGDVRHRPEHPPLRRRVHVRQQARAQALVALLVQPAQRVAEEVALGRRQAADLLAGLVLVGLLERFQAQQHAAVVGDVLAQAGLAVDVQARQRLVGVELRDHLLRGGVEARLVVLRPPAGEVALRVVLAALVVEAVGDLVADGAGRRVAVGDRIVDLRIGHARHGEDRRGQHDLVVRRVVVGVVGLRRHLPFGPVDGLAELRQVVLEAPARGGHHVGGVGLAADLQRGVVLPLVGITDLGRDRGELGERLLLGAGAHPVEALDAVAQRAPDRLHHRGVALLRRFGEILLHEDAAEHHAHRVAFFVERALPALALLLLARHRLAVEAEVLLVERRRQVRCVVVHQVVAQVVLQHRHRRRGDELVHRGQEFRLADDDVPRMDAPGAEARRPVDRGRVLRRELGRRHAVVVLLRIAQVGQLARSGGERRLELHHLRGGGLRARLVAAEQLQAARDVVDVLGADLGDALLGVEVEVALGQAQAALADVHRHRVAGLVVLADADAEQAAHADRLEIEDRVDRVGRRGDGVDARELPAQRRRAEALGQRGVHRRRPEVADLLLVAARRGLRLRRVLVDRAQARVELLVHRVADAPGRFRRRDRVRLQPAAIGVLEEVHARVHRPVHVRGQEIGLRRRGGRRAAVRRQRGSGDAQREGGAQQGAAEGMADRSHGGVPGAPARGAKAATLRSAGAGRQALEVTARPAVTGPAAGDTRR